MKTPIQELIDKWKQEKGSYIPNAPIFQEFINDAKEMLEKEKEVIIETSINSYTAGYLDNQAKVDDSMNFPEQYYNETFNTKEK